ncbi:hypothetical protein DUI87_30185 [Hirundo rustica rustica]|uniref:Selenoprotein P N-terminal domain-containing protein n=1 Tax=Hirundo rustica rustica TaxID=333673 RepID=A0A3M0IY91_HIRRU|nr:hypothetical protein DUI87_30185 [Hirundo rustica rustica]
MAAPPRRRAAAAPPPLPPVPPPVLLLLLLLLPPPAVPLGGGPGAAASREPPGPCRVKTVTVSTLPVLRENDISWSGAPPPAAAAESRLLLFVRSELPGRVAVQDDLDNTELPFFTLGEAEHGLSSMVRCGLETDFASSQIAEKLLVGVVLLSAVAAAGQVRPGERRPGLDLAGRQLGWKLQP